ncbi:Anthranilate synthase component II [Candidatus Rubidus massiliensis]|nr:Anthranilate synthase component II [Candidatus Rubidus massiliensis]
MIVLVDNFDSFTFNLVHALQMLGKSVKVVRNCPNLCQQLLKLQFSQLIIGPGPGSPKDFSSIQETLKIFSHKVPILGICLGHQCIAHFFGGKVIRATKPTHGKTSLIIHNEQGLFHSIPQNTSIGRYHSLIVEKVSLPSCLKVTAKTFDTDEIMGIQHCTLPIHGIQFHPESILTTNGLNLLKNFNN